MTQQPRKRFELLFLLELAVMLLQLYVVLYVLVTGITYWWYRGRP